MTSERIYFKAKAIGYYRTDEYRQTGSYYLHDIAITRLELINLTEIDPFDFNELKTGLFHKPEKKIKGVKIFIETDKFIKEDIRDILFRCIEKTDKIFVDGNEWIGFTADTYFIIERKIEVKPLLIPTISRRILWPFSKKNQSFETANHSELVNSTTINTNDNSTAINNPPSILGYIISFLFIVLMIGLFFSFSNTSFILLALLGISFLLTFLNERSPIFKSFFGVNFPLWNIIGWIFIFFSLLSIGKYGFNNGNICGFFIGLAIILWSRNSIWMRYLGQFSFFLVLLIFMANSGIIDGYDFDKVKTSKKKYTEDDEFIDYDNIKFKREIDTLENEQNEKLVREKLVHTLNWNDNYRRNHKATITILRQDYESAEIKRSRSEVNEVSALRYWNKVYAQIIFDNKEYLDQVIKTFKEIGKSKQLNKKEFADMVVSGIQNIPYYLVHDLSHEEAERQFGGFITDWHNSGGNCLEKIKFGIQSPAEFMGNFKGDCDTRSVLLFYVLSQFNYDVAILISEQYGHAILGIAGDYSGKFKQYNGIRYFVWETTATDFVPGILSPNYGNMNYWQIALTNN